MTDKLTVTIHAPYMRITRAYIEYVVDLEVNENGKQQKHEYISYDSVEEVVDKAEKHKEKILDGRAVLDAWLVAHGETFLDD